MFEIICWALLIYLSIGFVVSVITLFINSRFDPEDVSFDSEDEKAEFMKTYDYEAFSGVYKTVRTLSIVNVFWLPMLAFIFSDISIKIEEGKSE